MGTEGGHKKRGKTKIKAKSDSNKAVATTLRREMGLENTLRYIWSIRRGVLGLFS